MAQSQRVLSGSQTKGSSATPSGSIIYSYQGINAKTNESYFGSLLPRLGSGDRTALFLNNKRLPEKIFNDSITIGGAASLDSPQPGVKDTTNRVQTRIDFRYENRNLGQLDQRPEGYEFVETIEYDPVAYLQDQSQTMWPVNLFNSSMVPKYEFDGVIEPLEIRSEMLGLLDTRYEGHSIRGAVVGEYAEGPLGSKAVKSTWTKTDKPTTPFLDAPDLFGVSVVEQDISQGGTAQPVSMQPFQSLDVTTDYPYVERDYRNDLYSSVWSHNPLLFSQSMTPLNWNYTLTGSWMSKVDGLRYYSSGSLVWHFRFGGAQSELVGSAAPGSGQLFSQNAGKACSLKYTTSAADRALPLASFTGSFPQYVDGFGDEQMQKPVPIINARWTATTGSAYPVGPPNLQVNTSPSVITTGSYFFRNSTDKNLNPVVYVGGNNPVPGTLSGSAYPVLFPGEGISASPFTLSMWVYITGQSGTVPLFSIGGTGNNNLGYKKNSRSLFIQNSGTVFFWMGNDGTDNYAAYMGTQSGAVNPNQWNHIAVSFSGQWASGSMARNGTDAASRNQGFGHPVKMVINGINQTMTSASPEDKPPGNNDNANIPPGPITWDANYAAIGNVVRNVGGYDNNQVRSWPEFWAQFAAKPGYYISEAALWNEHFDEHQLKALHQAVSGTVSTRTTTKDYHIPWYYGSISGSLDNQPGAWSGLVDGKYPDYRYAQPSRTTINAVTGMEDATGTFAHNNILWLRFNDADKTRSYGQPVITGGTPNPQYWVADKSGNNNNAYFNTTGFGGIYTTAQYLARYVTTVPKDKVGDANISNACFQFNQVIGENAVVIKSSGTWNDVWGNINGSTAGPNHQSNNYRGVYPERAATLAFWVYVDGDIRSGALDTSKTDFTIIQIGSQSTTNKTVMLRINAYVSEVGGGAIGIKVERSVGIAYGMRFEGCMTPNQWNHVVITQRKQMWANYSGGSSPGNERPFYCYINGKQATNLFGGSDYYAAFPKIANPSSYFPSGDIDEYMVVGTREIAAANRTHAFKGKITDICMWNYELTSDTVKALYNAVSGSVTFQQGNTVFDHKNVGVPDPIRAGIEMFNSASYRETTDPLQKRANHGFYFKQKAGSITWGDL